MLFLSLLCDILPVNLFICSTILYTSYLVLFSMELSLNYYIIYLYLMFSISAYITNIHYKLSFNTAFFTNTKSCDIITFFLHVKSKLFLKLTALIFLLLLKIVKLSPVSNLSTSIYNPSCKQHNVLIDLKQTKIAYLIPCNLCYLYKIIHFFIMVGSCASEENYKNNSDICYYCCMYFSALFCCIYIDLLNGEIQKNWVTLCADGVMLNHIGSNFSTTVYLSSSNYSRNLYDFDIGLAIFIYLFLFYFFNIKIDSYYLVLYLKLLFYIIPIFKSFTYIIMPAYYLLIILYLQYACYIIYLSMHTLKSTNIKLLLKSFSKMYLKLYMLIAYRKLLPNLTILT